MSKESLMLTMDLSVPRKTRVRELENIIVQALVECRGNVLLKDDIDKLLNVTTRLPQMGLES